MKCILDAFVVLTKQDRKSIWAYQIFFGDPLFLSHFRSLSCCACHIRPILSNMAPSAKHHAALQSMVPLVHVTICLTLQIISLGDCSKSETHSYFYGRLMPSIPKHLRAHLSFDELYACFGGKFAHWSDYITDYGMWQQIISQLTFDLFCP